MATLEEIAIAFPCAVALSPYTTVLNISHLSSARNCELRKHNSMRRKEYHVHSDRKTQ